ncbi:MAG: SpoIID/LytB domain-containing protein [Candidatus Eisenbacteria bacterium]|uniref:SpoIID/LytB domain-containing protein n=1 Tax=Eiseniibacteriota bacterium TaxID=2212470 RepID=A0A937XCP5_UNCEI|nr:SpoIID/LytB domain-containing protein [Candidatus Eisenbacteria bacterium]
MSRRCPSLASALLLCAILQGACAPASRRAPAQPGSTPGREPVLRVALLAGAPRVRIECAGEVRVWRVGSGLAGAARPAGSAFELAALSPAGRAGETPTARLALIGARGDTLGVFAEALLFEPRSPEHPLQVGGRPYRGEILVRAEPGMRLTAINALRIEDYLLGVVPVEIGSSESTPGAALQAQAIAARSYALHYLGRRAASHGCDLLATVDDQAYGGIGAETGAASRAVAETRGIVAVHEGRAIRANYSSTCGGRTEEAERAWPGTGYPYLRSVRDAAGGGGFWCAESPHARWEVCWECGQLAEIVLARLPEEDPAARGRELGRLRDIEIAARSPSGRAEELRVSTDGGVFRVRGDRIRWLLRRPDGGPLRSTLIGRLRRSGKQECRICLEGRGFGHGVGMCQTGALGMARGGVPAEEILRRYYRGVHLARWW